jgi:hypothetical protein
MLVLPPQVALIVLAACGLSESTGTTARYISLLRLLKLVSAPGYLAFDTVACSIRFTWQAGSMGGAICPLTLATDSCDMVSCCVGLRAAPTASASSFPTWSST